MRKAPFGHRNAGRSRRVVLLGTVVLLAGCGGGSRARDAGAVGSATATARPTTGAACREPSGQEKAAVRFAVRTHDRELKDSPWALVRRRGARYIAAEIDSPGPRLVVLVVYRDDARYLAGLRAVNGTARTWTDLPHAGGRIPAAARRALACAGA